MKIKKIFFVGLGGAGQRHLRIFKELLPENVEFSAYRSKRKTPLLNSDFTVNDKMTLEEKYNLKTFDSLGGGLENKPDLIVVSTPSALHYDILKKAAEHKINIFVEKPFSNNLDGFEEFKKLIIKNDLYFFVSFQRRFHPYLMKIKEILSNEDIGKIISAVFNVGSYVPTWHSYEDFKKLYACNKKLGGGVLLTEIHELDLCYWYFGLPTSVYCSGGNFSNVNLDVEDTAHVALNYRNYAVQVNLCFMQQHNRRDLYISGTKGYIEWDSRGNKLIVHNYKDGKEEVFSDPDYKNDDMFKAQALYFLKNFKQSDKSYLDISKASLMIVEAAKKSMKEGKEIKIDSYMR